MIEYRGAQGKLDRIPNLVNELVQLKVDVLVVPIQSAIRAVKQATKTIPIVMVIGVDKGNKRPVPPLVRGSFEDDAPDT